MQNEENNSYPKRRRGIYLLPNLLTTGALFCGFYAIIAALGGHFSTAAVYVFAAMVLDGLDGRVARLTNTQTPFGAEYDSLSDLVAFGIAPAVLMFLWSLSHLGHFGWLIAFLYVAGTALRLARFNTQPNGDKCYFQGLPCPPAAAAMVSTIWISRVFQLDGSNLWVLIWCSVTTIALAGLMVSRVRYSSFKQVGVSGRVPFVAVLIVVAVFVAISINPPEVLFVCALAYALSGPVLTLLQIRKRRRFRRRHEANIRPSNQEPPAV